MLLGDMLAAENVAAEEVNRLVGDPKYSVSARDAAVILRVKAKDNLDVAGSGRLMLPRASFRRQLIANALNNAANRLDPPPAPTRIR